MQASDWLYDDSLQLQQWICHGSFSAGADWLLCHTGGALAFIGYLALLCQSLVACGQVKGRARVGPSWRQYQQLPVQEDGPSVSSQKRPEPGEGSRAIVELTVTAADSV